MNPINFDFEPKGPEAIKARMEQIRSRMAAPDRAAFQRQLDAATQKKVFGSSTPPPNLNGHIGDDKEQFGPLPPASPMDNPEFSVENSPGAAHQYTKLQIQGMISQVAREQNLDQNLLRAVVEAESDYNPYERSPKGAMGLMQLEPATAKELGVVDPYSPYENLTGGAKYLNQMLQRYGGNQQLALAAFNAGPGRVDAAKGIPNISETKNYVDKIMSKLGKR